MKLTLASLAAAPTSMVLPVPEGPWSRMPDWRLMGHLENSFGY